MPTRIYLCPIIGRGTENDPQRAAVSDDPKVTGCCAAIAVDRATGLKSFGWTICRVVASDFSGVDTVASAVRIPHASPGSLSSAALRNDLKVQLGTDVNLKATDTVRGVIGKLVKAHYPHADDKAML